MSKIIIQKPEKCHLWTSDLTKELLYNSFDTIKIYEDSSHLTRTLKKCKKCGQLYFYEFYEIMNFDRDDDQYISYIPVDCEKTADKLNELSQMELTSYLQISLNFPPYNSKPEWRE